MPRTVLFAIPLGLIFAGQATAQWTDRRDPAVEIPQGLPVTEGRFNAALQYHSLWMMLEPILEYAEFTPEELDAMDAGTLPGTYAALLESNQEQIADLIAATRLQTCDFGSSYEDGIETLLPHLATMRNTAKLLVNDARRLKDSDMDAVAQRLAATIRLGEHATQTSVVIGSLVGVAIVELARVETQKLLDAGELNAAQTRVINEALDRVLTDDPFNALGAIRAEAAMMPTWIKSRYTGDNAGREFIKIISLVKAGDAPEGRRPERELRRMNGEQIATVTDRMSEGYEQLIEAWQAEDPVAAMTEAEARLEGGEFGPVATVLMPALGNFRQKTLESEMNLRQLRTSLLAVPEG